MTSVPNYDSMFREFGKWISAIRRRRHAETERRRLDLAASQCFNEYRPGRMLNY